MTAPGKNYLKITGILFIILGIFEASLTSLNLLLTSSGEFRLFERTPVLLLFLFAAFHIFIGIMGVKYCATVSKSPFLVYIIFLDLLTDFYSIFIVNEKFYIAGIFLPLFYLVGTIKNNSAR